LLLQRSRRLGPIAARAIDHTLQPGFFPEDQARGFTTPVSAAVATRVKVHGVVDTSPAYRKHRVTRFVGALVDRENFAREGKHLRHERHPVQFALAVQRRKYFLSTPDLN
jgi:hypothetical protein